MSKAKSTAVARVYSYLRFSTPEQALGDSERRQIDAAMDWAKRKGLILDETLRMTDRGLSGYHGTHRKRGALGAFLIQVERGAVPRGSILLVENIDRLSREGVSSTLRDIIFKLWDKGITLQTLSPEETYEPGCDDNPKFLALLLYMQRARDESQQKSRRLSEARSRAREAAHKDGCTLTRQVPAWIRVTEGGERVAIKEAAQTVKLIFDLRLQGLSVRAIEKKLNAEAPWTPPKNPKRRTGGWRSSYIKKILSNRAVIGEYQPHRKVDGKRYPEGEAIAGYFPQVVKPDRFFAVQKLRKNTKGGRTGQARNLFTRLVKCAYCGGPMRFDDKGPPPKGARYLVCYNGERGCGCKSHRIRYDECQTTILNNCKGLRPEDVLPNPTEQSRRCRSLRQRIEGADEQIRCIEKRLNTLEDQIADALTKEIGRRLQEKMVELGQQREKLTESKADDELALRAAESDAQSFAIWKRSIETLQTAIGPDDAIELRMQLRQRLGEFISKIEVFAVGYQRLYDPHLDEDDSEPKPESVLDAKSGLRYTAYRRKRPHRGDTIEEYVEALYENAPPKLTRSRRFREFLKYIAQRRMSREGRFLRVFFKTGSAIDLVPPGSLASGLELERHKNDWRFVRPDLQRLWLDFEVKENVREVGVKRASP